MEIFVAINHPWSPSMLSTEEYDVAGQVCQHSLDSETHGISGFKARDLPIGGDLSRWGRGASTCQLANKRGSTDDLTPVLA